MSDEEQLRRAMRIVAQNAGQWEQLERKMGRKFTPQQREAIATRRQLLTIAPMLLLQMRAVMPQ